MIAVTRARLIRTALQLTATIGVVALIALPATSVGAVPGPTGSPHSKPTGLQELLAVSAVAPDTAIASGYDALEQTTPVESWDGTSWTESSGLDESTYVHDVAAVSSTDMWAVGGNSTNPVMQHWSGRSWKSFQGPAQRAYFQSVTAVSSKDVWAAGVGETEEQGPYFTVVEHWDGNKWSVIPSPTPNEQYTEIADVTATSDHDVWVAGNGDVPFYMHWDGTSWTTFEPNAGGSVAGLSEVAPDDVWAVGQDYDSQDGKVEAFTEHWDGTSWSIVASPKPHGYGNGLQACQRYLRK